jgi:hypothetical protein
MSALTPPTASVAAPTFPRAESGVEAALSLEARIARLLPWLAGAVTLIAALTAIEPLPVGVFYDDAQYLILAKALATGHGYRFLNLPGAPFATHFPPGYPAFLALLWRLAPSFPENVALFKFANAVLLAAVGIMTFAFARRRLELSPSLAFVATIAGTATIPSLVLSSAIMSEPLFLAALIPMLGWAERVAGIRTDGLRGRRDALLLGVAIAGLALVRTQGIALGAAVVVALVSERRWRDAFACGGALAVGLVPWMLWVQLHDAALPPLVRGAYGSYVGWLVAGLRADGWHLMAVTIPDNVATLWMALVRSLAPGGHALLDWGVGGVYALFAAAGVRGSWRRARVTTVFLACYVGMVVVWPFSPLRFYWGIWPLLMLLPAIGFFDLRQMAIVRHRVPRFALGLGAAVLVLSGVAFNTLGFANAWWSSNARFHARRVLPQLTWVERATSTDDVIGSDAEGAVYLYTGRRAVPITTFTAAEYAGERSVAEEAEIVRQQVARYQPRFVLATSPKLTQATDRLTQGVAPALVRADSIQNGVVFARR